MTVQETLELTQFPVVVETDCKNISRIYPLKQAIVAKLAAIAPKFAIIKSIVIFGSAVTAKCHINSDIDICIDACVDDGLKVFELQQAIGEICDWNCDIVMHSNIGKQLKKTIEEKGVKIYERIVA